MVKKKTNYIACGIHTGLRITDASLTAYIILGIGGS